MSIAYAKKSSLYIDVKAKNTAIRFGITVFRLGVILVEIANLIAYIFLHIGEGREAAAQYSVHMGDCNAVVYYRHF